MHEEQIFQQIDQVSRARAGLEKASAHMMLEIRKQMTAEQTARLDQHRPKPPRRDAHHRAKKSFFTEALEKIL